MLFYCLFTFLLSRNVQCDFPKNEILEPIVGEDLFVSNDKLHITLYAGKGNLYGKVGINLADSESPILYHSRDYGTLVWQQLQTTLNVTRIKQGDLVVYNFYWTTKLNYLNDGIQLENAAWFGGAEVFNQTWPISMNMDKTAFVTADIYQNKFGAVQERFWLNSDNFAIYVDDRVPLFLSWNKTGDGLLSLESHYTDMYTTFVEDPLKPYAKLNYQIITSNNPKLHLREFHLGLRRKLFPIPTDIPDPRMFVEPIWTTWAQFKKNINQSKVIQFANDINRNNFSNSQIEIDNAWSIQEGDFEFDREKFPDPKEMIRQLEVLGFRSTVWIHPFANITSKTAKDYLMSPYWLTRGDNQPQIYQTAVANWWEGLALAVDVTDSEAVDWFIGRLQEMRESYGFDSFKFDAGDTNWLPRCYRMKNMSFPNLYSNKWAEVGSKLGKMVEFRVGVKNQNLPNFVRVMDKDSKWGIDNGLEAMINQVLTLSVLGYSFVLPDIIGGNAYNDDYPDKELYIRWVQVTAFMPAMQFSIPPWVYDDTNVLQLTKKAIELHKSIQWVKLANESVVMQIPIIRPIWYSSTTESSPDEMHVKNQFLVGDDILVAPIVDPDPVVRNIFIPNGQWKSMADGSSLKGPQWININVTLNVIPYFIRTR